MIYWYIAVLVVSLFVSYETMSKTSSGQSDAANQLSDIDVPTISEGSSIDVCFGTTWVADENICGYWNAKATPIYKSSGSKGK